MKTIHIITKTAIALMAVIICSACSKEPFKMCYLVYDDGHVSTECLSENVTCLTSTSTATGGEYQLYESADACDADIENTKLILTNRQGGGSGGGNKPAMCDGGYVQPMPNGYTQSNITCEYAYTYICTGGYSPSSAEVKQICENYRNYQRVDDLKNCKYCQ